MTPAERFKMCMAEAGFPVAEATDEHPGGVGAFKVVGSISEGYWRAARRAGRLAGMPMSPCCDDCFVAARMTGDRSGQLPPCEHVEVSA